MDRTAVQTGLDGRAEGATTSATLDVRHLLNADELDRANGQIRRIVEDRVRHSTNFDPAAIDRIVESILNLPSVDAVVSQGGPAGPEENRRLGLGESVRIGTEFAGAIRDLRGAAAIDMVKRAFEQLQTRYHCTLLRVLGARNDARTSRMHVRLEAADRSCIDSLECDGEVYALRDLPLFPLPGCLSRQCTCKLELIESRNGQAPRRRLPRGVRRFFLRLFRRRRTLAAR